MVSGAGKVSGRGVLDEVGKARSQKDYKPPPGDFLGKGKPGRELLKGMIYFTSLEGLQPISCFVF